MKKRITVLIVILCLTSAFLAGCKGKKEEVVNRGKSAPVQTEADEVESPQDQEKDQRNPSHNPSNIPPKILSAKIVPDLAYATTDLRVEVEAEDPDNSVINYTYQWLRVKPGGSPDQGEIIEGEEGPALSYNLFKRGDSLAARVTPSDWYSKGASYQTKWVVIANSPPRIISKPPKTILDEKTYTYQVEAVDPDGDPIRFSLGEGAPEGMSIDPSTGLITWPISADVVGTYKITVLADDGNDGSCFQRYTFTLKSESTRPSEN